MGVCGVRFLGCGFVGVFGDPKDQFVSKIYFEICPFSVWFLVQPSHGNHFAKFLLGKNGKNYKKQNKPRRRFCVGGFQNMGSKVST